MFVVICYLVIENEYRTHRFLEPSQGCLSISPPARSFLVFFSPGKHSLPPHNFFFFIRFGFIYSSTTLAIPLWDFKKRMSTYDPRGKRTELSDQSDKKTCNTREGKVWDSIKNSRNYKPKVREIPLHFMQS